jgi:hypothetical protein
MSLQDKDGNGIEPIGDAFLFSVNKTAKAFGLDRATVQRYIDAAELPAAALRGGHPVYRLADIARAIYATPTDDDDLEDPDGPNRRFRSSHDRRSWWQSELVRMQVAERQGQLVPIEGYRRALGDALRAVAMALDELPSSLERDFLLPPEQVESIEASIDRLRAGLADRVRAAVAGDDDA